MKTRTATCIFVLIITIFSLHACIQNSKPAPDPTPSGLTILGLDGASWEVIDLLINRGELPGFKMLKEKGSWGYLDTFVPTESVAIWTSIATGVSPSGHGLQTFTRRIPGTDDHVPSPGSDRRVLALWNMVSKHQKSVVTAKWFATWPAEEVNGAMLSPRLEAEDADPRTYPTELFTEIDMFRYKSVMDSLPQPPLPAKHLSSLPKKNATAPALPAAGPPMLIGQNQVPSTMFDDTSVWLAALHLFEKYHPDLFMLYMKSTDRVQHFLWGAHQNPTGDIQKAEAEAIFGWYRFYDDIILRLLQDDTRVLMVVSDHGFQASADVPNPYHTSDINFDRILECIGFLVTSGSNTNWPLTRAYTYRPYPFDRAVEFRLNLKSREPNGTVTSAEKSATLEDLVARLSGLKTSDGSVVFKAVRPLEEDAGVYCRLSDRITLDDTIMCNDREHKLNDFIFQKGLPRGIHTDAPAGIFAVLGPGITEGRCINNASVFDVAPTALHILGLPVAADFDGRVLDTVFTTDFFKRHPIRTIATYGTRQSSDNLVTTEGDDRMLDELRALGYIQ